MRGPETMQGNAQKRFLQLHNVTHSLGKGNATDLQTISFIPPMGQIHMDKAVNHLLKNVTGFAA